MHQLVPRQFDCWFAVYKCAVICAFVTVHKLFFFKIKKKIDCFFIIGFVTNPWLLHSWKVLIGICFWQSYQPVGSYSSECSYALFFWFFYVFLWCFCYRQTRKGYHLAGWKSMRLLHLFSTQLGIMRQSTGTALTIICLLNLWPCLLTVSLADPATLLGRLCILNARLWSRCLLPQLGPSMVG